MALFSHYTSVPTISFWQFCLFWKKKAESSTGVSSQVQTNVDTVQTPGMQYIACFGSLTLTYNYIN